MVTQGVWTGAASRISLRLLLVQIVGNAVLATGAFAWLEVPDSHTWQFVLSVVWALALVLGFLWLWTETVHIMRRPERPSSRVFAACWIIGTVLAAFLWVHWVSRLDTGVEIRGGYWNSQLSAHLRMTFTYERLVHIQNIVIAMLESVVPLMLLPLLVAGVAGDALRSGVRVWTRWQFWLIAIVALVAGLAFTAAISDWHPAHTVHGEIVSAALRLMGAYVVDVLLVCAVLGFVSEILMRADAAHGSLRHAGAEPSSDSGQSVRGD
jgi:hypothetical protein